MVTALRPQNKDTLKVDLSSCHAMIHNQNADTMVLASARLRNIPPGLPPFWILLRVWMPLKRHCLGPLSYTILLEDVLGMKKCRQKHGGFLRHMTPFPWQLVPPAHEITTDQAQFWARCNILSKIFWLFEVFAVNSRCFFIFFRLLTIGSNI
jgi:hypothetical protein